MTPKSVVGICFFITAPSINHQYIFLLCCTSGCKDHFVVLVALVNPTSSFNRSYWSIVLETDSSLKLHLHCCCRCHYNDVFGDKIEYSSWQVHLPYFTIFGQLIGWYCSNFYPPPPFPYTCLFLLNVIFEHQQKILLLENVSVRNELNVYPTYTSITWVLAKTAYIIWVQKCLQSSKYQAKIDANEYQNKGNASYISNLNWISSQRLRIALYFIRETIPPSNCLIVQCYISQWIEKKCRLFVHYS